MKQRLYFAYGSNINLHQMAQRCPNAVPVMPVTLHGYALAFRGHSGVATVLTKEGAKVYGLLWDLTPQCEKSLDRYEGYPDLYGKETVPVRDEKTGASYRVMVYIMTPQYAEIIQEPSPAYFNGILQGYKQNGLPIGPLYNALCATREEISVLEQQTRDDFGQLNFDWLWDKYKGKNIRHKPKNKGR